METSTLVTHLAELCSTMQAYLLGTDTDRTRLRLTCHLGAALSEVNHRLGRTTPGWAPDSEPLAVLLAVELAVDELDAAADGLLGPTGVPTALETVWRALVAVAAWWSNQARAPRAACV